MAIVDSINSLATRIGQEFQSIRSEITSAVSSLTSSRAAQSTTITGATSLTGGGDLSANRTLSLVNDNATPGNSKYYGTDGSGAKGFHDLPAGGGGAGAWTLLGVQVGPSMNVVTLPDSKTVSQFLGGISEIVLCARDNAGGNVVTALAPSSLYAGSNSFALNVRRFNPTTTNDIIVGECYGELSGTQIRIVGALFNGTNYTASVFYR